MEFYAIKLNKEVVYLGSYASQKEAEYKNSDMGYLTILSETMLKELHIQILNALQKENKLL